MNLSVHFRCVVHGFFFSRIIDAKCVILIFNWCILVLTLRKMHLNLKPQKIRKTDDNQEDNTWSQLWRFAVCATLLGLSWTFAVLAVSDLSGVFQ